MDDFPPPIGQEKPMQRDVSTYPHESLWRAAQSALRTAAIDHPEVRTDHLAIQAALCGFLAFEGFVNVVGQEIASTVWAKEWEFFSQLESRGIEGKVKYLFTLFPESEGLKKGCEPYQTFKQLKLVRDSLAHPLPKHYREPSIDPNPSFITCWDKFDSPEKVAAALAQLKILAELIRTEALKVLREEYALSPLHYPAFEGPLGGSMTVTPTSC